MKRTLWSVLLLAATGQLWACEPLKAVDPWARLAPPNAAVMAGYVTLSNDGDSAISVQAGSSKDFERVELHSMSMDNGVMQMRKLDAIEVKNGAELTLAPGGMHLMLIGPKHAFAAGDSIDVVLKLCGEMEQTITLTVREPTPE